MKSNIKNIIKLFHKKANSLRVISNPEKGVVKVYDGKGKLLLKKINLTREQVESIEYSFLGFIANKLNTSNKKLKNDSFDPMVV